MDPTIKDFESAIAELETIVKTLEEGDLALEKSLALFERGVTLSRFCHTKLEEAERRVEILNERGEIRAAPASLAGEPDDRGRWTSFAGGWSRGAPTSTRRSSATCRGRRPVPRASARRCATVCS